MPSAEEASRLKGAIRNGSLYRSYL
ncbi:hypothetical protein XFF7767_1030088 [Xanthomonas citri pv. fuscans]|nr:hypothetical protein BN1263130027 [Stenotrophomonas maltophilia]SON98430.1 hypothetical protein XFF7767_1030088 [Xanthomonas citri pv. fuscans]SOO12898.1 hypothetical protein XFF7766_1140089 [Xanthomonas citri pv. fuscans]SOO42368.1 hypothetical protein XFF1815_180086 [Xanthomonas citri pv. fuscans]